MFSRRLWIIIAGLASILLLGVGVAVAGGDPNDKVLTGDRVTIEAGETVGHDLYVFGGDLVVDGMVEGDLVAGAGMVTINGTVDGDLVVGSGRVFVNGEVTGDVVPGPARSRSTGRWGRTCWQGPESFASALPARWGRTSSSVPARSWSSMATVDGSMLGTASDVHPHRHGGRDRGRDHRERARPASRARLEPDLRARPHPG